MKRFSILTAMLLLAVAGCNKEPQALVDGSGQNQGENFYVSFKVDTPSTKSSTEEDGTSDAEPDVEPGQDYENMIKNVDVILVCQDNPAADNMQSVVAGVVELSEAQPDVFVATFSRTEILPGAKYKVYLYVNDYKKRWVSGDTETVSFDINESETLTNDTDLDNYSSKSNGFFMTNADPDAKNLVNLPSEAEMARYTSEQTPYDLGTFNVERAVARFDFRDGSNNDNTYTWKQTDAATGAEVESPVKIKLTDLSLMNMSKAFYHFRRVSADGTSEDAEVGAAETKTNYVVDTDWDWKKVSAGKMLANPAQEVTDFAAHYFYHMSSTEERDWDPISEITVADKWDGAQEYKIWRYAVENTIPDDGTVENPNNNSYQLHALTTGVAFKGQILPSDAASDDLKAAMTDGDALYVYNNVMYGSWAMTCAAASDTEKPNYALMAALKQYCNAANLVYDTVVAGNDEPGTDADVVSALADAGFKRFSAKDVDGSKVYEVQYNYWNQHNDNGYDAAMGAMEFAVVRNNVYKLAVTQISGFGHPTSSTDPDPDPDDPDDPDEDLKYYFRVAVKVLPWVVRVNDIEF